MKVEHEGIYAIVASKGGAVNHPGWYHNLLADPTVLIQDGPEPFETTVRLATGGERAEWWDRSVAAFSPYAILNFRRKLFEIPAFKMRVHLGRIIEVDRSTRARNSRSLSKCHWVRRA